MSKCVLLMYYIPQWSSVQHQRHHHLELCRLVMQMQQHSYPSLPVTRLQLQLILQQDAAFPDHCNNFATGSCSDTPIDVPATGTSFRSIGLRPCGALSLLRQQARLPHDHYLQSGSGTSMHASTSVTLAPSSSSSMTMLGHLSPAVILTTTASAW
jgi:hypothetical protein